MSVQHGTVGNAQFESVRHTGNAHAKALIHRDMLRVAAQAGLKSTPQSVLSILIAEAWPHAPSRYWYCATTQHRLAVRLSCGERTIRRAVAELRDANLLRVTVNPQKTKARYWLNDLVQPLKSEAPAAQPTGGDTGVRAGSVGGHQCPGGPDTSGLYGGTPVATSTKKT